MTNEQDPLKVDIPVEEEEQVHKAESVDIAAELRNLGKQLAQTLEAAWQSEERQRVEQEIREGVEYFADEVTKVFDEAKESPAAHKVREEADEIKTRLETSEISAKTKNTFAKGLSWLSEELARLSEKFTPPEKSPEDIDDGSGDV